jgi:2,3-dihydro-2,3-dihydroxybenzoate dehydrogenase
MSAGSLSGQVVVVTGAAGGIGSGIVERVSAEGACVAAVDVDTAGLAGLRGGGSVRDYQVDVTSATAVDDLVARVERELGPINALVNAAGILHPGTVLETTPKSWEDTLAVNTTGVYLMSRAVSRQLVRHRGGAIVTVASNAASIARMGMAAYAASKAASIAFTKCLGLELAEHGIRCNVVSPGSTDTPMLRALFSDGGEADEVIEAIEGTPRDFRVGIPLRRLAAPEDIAAAVMFLLSSDARHVTMHDLIVDGGATLGV